MAAGLLRRRLGEFELTELIGAGGSGQVFRARQTTLDREAVVKVLRVDGRRRESTVGRFLGEAKVASRLDHPFAAHVYAFGAEPDGVFWIAMELVRGTPLDRVLEHGPLPVDRAVPFLGRLCEVVQTAHDQGIVHRDLKPSNVMVISRAGSVFPKLIDLGIARDQEPSGDPARRTDGAGGPIGTPFYMAPEQWIDAARAGPPADIYALGALTYEVLVGRPPFEGDSVLAVAAGHARAPVPRLPDGFASPLSDVIARAMAKRPHERFASALDLGAALLDAAGLGVGSIALPQLDDAVRARVTLSAPRPIAEAFALLDSARNPHQAQIALGQLARVICQYVGLVALACRTRSGPGRRSDRARVFELLRELRHGRLEPDGWWQLARELCRSFRAIPDAHPIPELVDLFFDVSGERATAMESLIAAVQPDRASGATEQARRSIAEALPRVTAALDSVRFLDDYRLVVGREVWMGVRRPQQAVIAVEPSHDAAPVLIGTDSRPVVSLAPLVQAAPPSPNATIELFLLDGAARDVACLVALPHGFERLDPSVWEWLANGLGEMKAGNDRSDDDQRAPYRGLATFEDSDADSFLGREAEVETFTNRLRVAPLLAIVGPSGVGKSSFVRAGVVPALGRRGAIRRMTLRPGPSPLAGLTAQLAAIGAPVSADEIAGDPDLVGEQLRSLAAAEQIQVVVVVDQFEELFTLCQDPVERAAYAGAVLGAARATEDPVRVIIAVRDDFLVRASALPGFRHRLVSGLHVMSTPSPDELRRILAEPARRAGYQFEDGLLDEMIGDVIEGPGALALLSFTAYQLWQLRDRHFHQLPRKAYRALGGVGGALGRHAEDTLSSMSLEQQRLVRVAFRHLVTAEGTRSVVGHDDLLAVVATSASSRDLGASVVEKLIDARLLVVSKGDRGEQRVEVAHEALLAAWPRVVSWRLEDAERVRFRDHLRAAARQWDERGRPAGLLWRGDALLEYRLWRPRFRDPLAGIEDEFARASERDASRTRRLRQIAVATVIAVMAVVSIVLWQLSQRAEASAQAARQRLVSSLIEQGRQSLLEGNPAAALLYLSDAYSRGADGPSLRFMLGRARRAMAAVAREIELGAPIASNTVVAVPGQDVVVAAIGSSLRAWSMATGEATAELAIDRAPDELLSGERRVLSIPATADGKGAVVWAPTTGEHRVLGADAVQLTGDISVDGRRAVLVGEAGTTVWDCETGTQIAALATPAPAVAAEISAGGERVATMSFDKTLRVWDVGTATAIATFATGEVAALGGFDRSAQRVLTLDYTGELSARLWHTSGDGGAPVAMRGHQLAILAGAVSPDGERIATGSRDRTVKVWDAATGRLRLDLSGHRGLVDRVVFSRDGKRLLSTSADRSARVWDAITGAEIATVALPALRGAVLSDDGRHIVTATADRLELWPARNPDLALELGDHSAPVIAAAFSPDGRWIATEDRRQIVRVWERDTGRLVHTLDEFDLVDDTAASFGLALRNQRKLPAFDPGGTRLAAPVGNHVAVWDVATGRRLRLLEGHRDLVSSVRFSRDGTALITAGQDGVARVWSGASMEPSHELADGEGPLWYAELSPDGARAITAGDAGVRVWELGRARPVHSDDQRDEFQSGAFAADGRRVAAAGLSGRIVIWSVDSGEVEATIDTGSRNVRAVRFLGSELLVTTAGDGLTRVWDAARLVELSRFGVGGVGGEGGGIERWVEVSPDGGQVAVTGSDRTARVWTLELERRDPATIAAWVRCHVPLDLVDQRIVARPRTEADCEGTR